MEASSGGVGLPQPPGPLWMEVWPLGPGAVASRVWSSGLQARGGVGVCCWDLVPCRDICFVSTPWEVEEPPWGSLRPGHYVTCLHFIVRPNHCIEKYLLK